MIHEFAIDYTDFAEKFNHQSSIINNQLKWRALGRVFGLMRMGILDIV
jgi:hypothetical protein